MDKYVARQPVKRLEDGKILGYELLFQNDHDSLYNSQENAAADTIAGFLMQNNEKIFHDNLTFVTFTPSLLFRNTAQIFDKEKLVIQLEGNVLIHPLAPVMVKKYHEQGYCFAITDFQFQPRYFSMLEYASFVKVNVKDYGAEHKKDSLDNLVNVMHGFNKKCIVTGINKKEDYELAKEAKADFVEGNYIASSMLSKYNKMDYLQGNFFQLVVEVTKDEPDIDEIEKIISRDTGLVYALLKMVNSAYFALKNRISSIRQALVTMGINQLKQWVYLMSFSDADGNAASEEFLKKSFLRATFCAEIAELVKDLPISASEAYMMGMFSTLEYMIDAPLEEILAEIPISEEIKTALVSREGICGKLYDLVIEYEQANWKKLKVLADEFQLSPKVLAQMYMDCVETVNEIWDNLAESTVLKEEAEAATAAAAEIEAETGEGK